MEAPELEAKSMTYLKEMQEYLIMETPEFEAGLRNLTYLVPEELLDQSFVVKHLSAIGLKEMALLIGALKSEDFQDLVNGFSFQYLKEITELH